MNITVKSPADIEKMRIAGRLAAEVLQVVAPFVKPGVSTAELDRICHDHIVNVQGAVPAKYIRLVSPCQPSLITVTSMVTMSPSFRTLLSLGMPWQMTLFTDVQIVAGKPL